MFHVDKFALQLIKILNNAGYEGYLVGGCVRDLILERNPKDWDIATSACPDEIINVLKNNKIKYSTVGYNYGTVVAISILGIEYEITTYRSDVSYSDGRHPDSVNFEKSIEADLSRRDFTMNALAYNPITDTLIDLFNGEEHIKRRIIRTVGNPDDRFKEDALRIVRALRFSIVYEFDIEPETVGGMHNNVDLIDKVSKERLTSELKKMLACKTPIKYDFMDFSDIVFKIIPELKPCYKFNQNNKYHQHDAYEHILYVVDNCETDDYIVKLAALLHDIGKPDAYFVGDDGYGHFYGHPEISYEITKKVLKNDLRLTREESDKLLTLVRYHDMQVASTPRSIKKLLNKFDIDTINQWIVLKKADEQDHIHLKDYYKYCIDEQYIKDTIQRLLENEACFKLKDLAIDGNDIMKLLNLKPCRHIGEILQTLLDEVIDEKISNDKDVLKARALEIYSTL